MDKLLGKKKYKGTLTNRPSDRTQHLKKSTSRASLAGRPSNVSELSLEPLDLRGNFFNQDDTSNHMKTPVGGYDDSSKGYFGAARKGYAAPVEQSEFRHSGDSVPSRAVSTKYSRSSRERDSHSIRRSQSTKSGASFATTDSAIPLPLSVPPHRLPYTRFDSYHHGYDVTDTTKLNNFAGTTPLASPLMSPKVDEHFLAADDPFDHYYDAQTSLPASEHHAVTPPPPQSSNAQYIENEKYHALLAEDHYDTEAPLRNKIPPMDHKKSNRSYSAAYRNSILKDQLAEMTYTEKRSTGSRSLRSSDEDETSALPLHKKAVRKASKWYRGWSTRAIILLIVGMICLGALILGVTLGIYFRNKNLAMAGLTPTWRPSQGTTFNIQLLQPMNASPSTKLYTYNVYDIDLFDNNATTIAMLHSMGRKVICYFSAGTYESWRPDASLFPSSTLGSALPSWAGERWVDVRDKNVRAIMQARIDLAIKKGCDGVDPDNVDGYNANTSFPLTVATNIEYVNYLAKYAHTSDIAIGLKNAPELINGTINQLDWEISESCAAEGACGLYQPFIQAGKPVFHLEYTQSGANATLLEQSCNAKGTHGFSTLVKRVKLDSWAMSCPIGDTTMMYGSDASM